MNEFNQELNQIEENDENNVQEIVDVLWNGRSSIAIISSIFFIGSIIYALTATHLWTSSSLITVVADATIDSAKQSMGSLRNIPGIQLSGGLKDGPERQDIAMAVLKSRDFLKHLLKFESVLPNLMAAQGYDPLTQEIEYDPEIYSKDNGWVIQKPSYHKALRKYKDIVFINNNSITGLQSISVTHVSPIFAHEFLSLIIREINVLERNRDLLEAETTLTYLYEELDKTQWVDVRISINQLIESQMKRKMLARVKTNYIIEPLDSPFIPEERSFPQRTKIVIALTAVGFIFAFFANLIGYYAFKRFNLFKPIN